jgi:hypothetical protein
LPEALFMEPTFFLRLRNKRARQGGQHTLDT